MEIDNLGGSVRAREKRKPLKTLFFSFYLFVSLFLWLGFFSFACIVFAL